MKQFGHKKKITNQKQKDKENSNRCNRHMKEEKKKIILFGDILGILFLISETLNQTLNKPPIKKIKFFYKPSTIKTKLNFRMQNN